MDIERIIDDIEQLQEMFEAPDIRPLSASVVTSKPANGGHGKTGQRRWPGTRLFYSAESSACKFVFVRQLRGPHLSTCP
jgi:hypothetical protein